MPTAFYWMIVGLSLMFGTRYEQCMPAHDILAGAVIQASDLGLCSPLWSTQKENYPEKISDLVGHKALKPLSSKSNIHLSDLLGDDAAKKATHDMVEYCRQVGQAKCTQGMYHWKTIWTNEDIPVGAIIRKKDLDPQRGDFWSNEDQGFATRLDQVVDHIALKPIHAGRNIRLSDVNQ